MLNPEEQYYKSQSAFVKIKVEKSWLYLNNHKGKRLQKNCFCYCTK